MYTLSRGRPRAEKTFRAPIAISFRLKYIGEHHSSQLVAQTMPVADNMRRCSCSSIPAKNMAGHDMKLEYLHNLL